MFELEKGSSVCAGVFGVCTCLHKGEQNVIENRAIIGYLNLFIMLIYFLR